MHVSSLNGLINANYNNNWLTVKNGALCLEKKDWRIVRWIKGLVGSIIGHDFYAHVRLAKVSHAIFNNYKTDANKDSDKTEKYLDLCHRFSYNPFYKKLKPQNYSTMVHTAQLIKRDFKQEKPVHFPKPDKPISLKWPQIDDSFTENENNFIELIKKIPGYQHHLNKLPLKALKEFAKDKEINLHNDTVFVDCNAQVYIKVIIPQNKLQSTQLGKKFKIPAQDPNGLVGQLTPDGKPLPVYFENVKDTQDVIALIESNKTKIHPDGTFILPNGTSLNVSKLDQKNLSKGILAGETVKITLLVPITPPKPIYTPMYLDENGWHN